MRRILTLASLLALTDPAHAMGGGHNPRPPTNYAGPETSLFGVVRSVVHTAQRVLTSFYGHGERLNQRTSTGEVFNPNGLTAAHRTLPFGTQLQVTYGDKTVVVRVNDRGPASWTGRSLDLSYGAAQRLGLVARGTAFVEVAILN